MTDDDFDDDERTLVDALTLRQRAFLYAYLRLNNASAAAREAGYSTPDKAGYRLARTPAILEAIRDFYRHRAMSAEEVVGRLSEQGRAAYAPYLMPDGTVDLENMLGDGFAHLIRGFHPGEFGLRVEFHDAQSALVHVARHLKLFTDNVDISSQGRAIHQIDVILPGGSDGG